MKKTAAFAMMATLAIGAPALADGDYVHTFDITGWQTWDSWSFGNPATANPNTGNPNFFALPNSNGQLAWITGVSWDVEIFAGGANWLSEFRVGITATDGAFDTGVFLTPGVGDNFGGTGSYSGSIKLGDVGIPDIVLNDGTMYMEAFTSWPFETPGHTVISGFITVQYNVIPAPGALALLGLAGCFAASRRRRA